MDFADLMRRANAQRESVFDAGGGRSITLRLPTEHQMRVAVLRAGRTDAAAWAVMQRALLEQGIVAWSGVTLADLLTNGGDEAVDWDAAAVPLLLDGRPDIATALAADLTRRMAERTAAKDAAAGN